MTPVVLPTVTLSEAGGPADLLMMMLKVVPRRPDRAVVAKVEVKDVTPWIAVIIPLVRRLAHLDDRQFMMRIESRKVYAGLDNFS